MAAMLRDGWIEMRPGDDDPGAIALMHKLSTEVAQALARVRDRRAAPRRHLTPPGVDIGVDTGADADPGRVVALVADLMDRSRLGAAIPGIEFTRDAAGRAGAAVVIVDLARLRDLAAELAAVRAAAPAARILGFGPHVEGAALEAARAAGADLVLPRLASSSTIRRPPWLPWSGASIRGNDLGEERGRTSRERHRGAPRSMRPTAPAPSPSSVPRGRRRGPASSGPASTRTPRAWPRRCRRRGVGPGDHVALLGPTSRALVTAIQATWLAGATLVCLPLPMRLGSIEEFVGADPEADRATPTPRCVVVDPELAPFLAIEPGDPPVVGLDELRGSPSGAWRAPGRRSRAARDPAVHERVDGRSEGRDAPPPALCRTTSTPSSKALGSTSTDVGVSWLPLYHDMGLIGLLMTPMLTGFDLVIARPAGLPRGTRATGCDWMSDVRAAPSPPARTSRTRSPPARCGASTASTCRAWRIALNGAEPIDPAAVESFVEAGAPSRPATRGRAFSRLRDGRGDARHHVPGPGDRHDRRRRRPTSRSRTSATPHPSRRERRRAPPRRGSATRSAGSSCASATPRPARRSPTARSASSRSRGTSVTPGYYRRPELTAATFHDGLAAHRRPRLPGRRRGRRLRAHQGRDHRRRPQRLPRRRRAGRRPRSTACAPAT